VVLTRKIVTGRVRLIKNRAARVLFRAWDGSRTVWEQRLAGREDASRLQVLDIDFARIHRRKTGGFARKEQIVTRIYAWSIIKKT